MNAPMRHHRAGLGASVQALGRLKTGSMNKTEEAYARHLEGLKAAGDVAWYLFEAVKLRLADNCFYSPDFAVMRADGMIEMHEVKGFWADDARVKVKVAAERFPLRFVAIRAITKTKTREAGWEVEDFS